MDYKNLVLIGTSHISKESVSKVTEKFSEFKPDIVALELDKRRFYALINNIESKPSFSDIRRVGINGFLFLLIGTWMQKKLGKFTGVSPGSEMKTAIDLARDNNLKIALIDQDIEVTLRRFSQTFGWKEKLSMIKDILLAPFSKSVTMDLSKVPEKKMIKALMAETKKRYPGIYKALVEERNEIMAANIIKILTDNPDSKVLAVVGAGHEEEILKIVESKKEKQQSHNRQNSQY